MAERRDSDIERLLAGDLDVRDEKLRVQALVRLADAAETVLDRLPSDDAQAAICVALLKVMSATTAVISLVDQERGLLVPHAAFDVGGVRTRPEGTRPLVGDTGIERVVGEQVPQFLRPAGERTDAPAASSPAQMPHGWLALPLVDRGRTVGMLELMAGDGSRRYSTSELALAQRVAASLATALVAGGAVDAAQAAPAAPPATSAPVINGQAEFKRTLDDLARRLCEVVAVASCDVLVRQAPTGTLKVIAHHATGGDEQPPVPQGRDYGLGETGARGRAIAMRQVTHVRDDDADLAAEERAEMATRGERAAMYTPIVSEDSVVGLLCAVETRVARRFTPAEEAFAQEIAWEAAVAVSSARIVEQLRDQNEELKLLLETGSAIASSVDLRETLSTITERLVKTLGVAWSDIYDYHSETGELEVVAYYQIPGVPEDPTWVGQRYDAGTWPEGLRCVTDRVPQTKYYDYTKLTPEEFAYMEPWGEKATLAVPMVHGEEVLGVLDITESRYPRRFTDEEVRLAQAIANQAAVAVHNARLYDEATRRNDELATILGATEALVSTVDLNEVLLAVSWRLREALGSEVVEIYEYEPVLSRLTHVVHAAADEYWYETPEWIGVYDLADDEFLTRSITRRETMVVYVDDPDVPQQTRDEMKKWDDTAALWIPMVYKDEVLGMVWTSEVEPNRRFSQEDIRLAQAIVAQGAVAVANAQAYQRVEEEKARLAEFNARLTAFAELSAQLRGLLTEAEMLDVLGRVISDALGFRQWVAYVYHPDDRHYRVAAFVGATPEIDEQYRGTLVPEAVIRGLLADATRISQSLFVDHLVHTWSDEEHAYMPGSVEGERADHEWDSDDTLFVPMVGQRGDVIGYVEAYDPVDRQRPTEDIVHLLEIVAGKAAGAIELQRAYAELELQSQTDGLTGLFNHRHFQERLRQEVARAARQGHSLTLLMIDVDDFKEFNDTYGHPQGDELLRRLAGLLVECTRTDVDFVARYGGEEFAVLLPETGVGGGETAAERLHDRFTAERTAEAVAEAIRSATEEQATAGVVDDLEVSITISIGVAGFPEHAQTPDQLVANADKALYHAKRLGKNRFAVYEE